MYWKATTNFFKQHGVIDYERIISNLKLEDGLILDIKGVQAAEGALVSRYFMYPSVYQHHTTRIVNSMFRRALKKVIDDGIINENDIYKYDDAEIIGVFRHCEDEFVNDMMENLLLDRIPCIWYDGIRKEACL